MLIQRGNAEEVELLAANAKRGTAAKRIHKIA
jgi:hypothetical protein